MATKDGDQDRAEGRRKFAPRIRDGLPERCPGRAVARYYAAFTLGLPDLDITPSRLATLLGQAKGDDWSAAAADLIAAEIDGHR
ncbi:MAG: hypothetical protein R2849_21370 [Thermomicrobiales bacterium]